MKTSGFRVLGLAVQGLGGLLKDRGGFWSTGRDALPRGSLYSV